MSGGQRFKPRLVREIEDVVTGEKRRVANDALEPLPYKPEHTELIMRALHGVTQEGTSVRSFAGAPYKSGGKTGTAQAVGIKANQKYDASKMEEHKRDHSLYIAVAPLPQPDHRAWRWWWKTPASARKPQRRSRAASSTSCCSASTRARRTWSPRARASRARPSARRAAPPTCRCRVR